MREFLKLLGMAYEYEHGAFPIRFARALKRAWRGYWWKPDTRFPLRLDSLGISIEDVEERVRDLEVCDD